MAEITPPIFLLCEPSLIRELHEVRLVVGVNTNLPLDDGIDRKYRDIIVELTELKDGPNRADGIATDYEEYATMPRVRYLGRERRVVIRNEQPNEGRAVCSGGSLGTSLVDRDHAFDRLVVVTGALESFPDVF